MYQYVALDAARSPHLWMRLSREQSRNNYRTSLPTSDSPPPYDYAIDGSLPSPRYEVNEDVPSTSDNATPSQITQTATPASPMPVTPQSKLSFTLNGKEMTAPLITVKTVKAHLRLLACFAQLRKDVLENKQPDLEAAGVTDEDRWAIFLVRAHHRFETWLSVRACEPETYDLPTADFLFIWYTYLVHPRLYFEDNGREAISHGFNVEQAAALVDPVTNKLALPPISPEARARTENVLGYNIDVLYEVVPDPDINDTDNLLPVMCPTCRQEHWVPYLSLKEPTSGYAHRDFLLECNQCGMLINRQKLAVARFALTLLLFMKQQIYLVGTQLHPATGRPDGFFAATLNNGMLLPFVRLCEDCNTFGEVGDRLNWSMDVVEELLRNSPMGWPLPDRVSKILSCYSQPQFSLDLVAATQRQTLFINQLEELGWLDPNAFESDSTPLELAIGRYHQYLDLLATESNMKNALIPTLDINLVMQAHLTLATNYRQTCHLTLGLLPDNNQELPQKDLLSNYERTAKLFKARFKQSYSTCGCERSALSARVTGALKLSGKKATNLDDVLRVLARAEERETFATSRDLPTLGLATHPCTHNMIYHAGTKRLKKANKVASVGHINTLLVPPSSWLPYLDPASGYGYTTDKSEDMSSASTSTNDDRVRPWITR
ncbi:hypothetical protein P389DRAFT_104245 [Cystobasidium minutum MCA 4210]|uniref:uncharacterized protein n=1 Tax=Cystobasidium minutum MCA 4210 TaxID=1397322 RepID=UPI0034D00A39|eukprot:jgi/Rhomi1/104245/CE104244_976